MKPILKWVGGKSWLLPKLYQIWQSQSSKKLLEPFVGGLSVALGLKPETAILNDLNPHLINFYRQVKKGLLVTENLQNSSNYYYTVRDQFNQLIREKQYNTQQAAQYFYYLIKTGYNGLCRFNLSGEFNVPFGKYNSINYKTDFLDYRSVLTKWKFTLQDFAKLSVGSDFFIYADPPFDDTFTSYMGKVFTWGDQQRLAAWLCQHDGLVIASNQATKRILELYQDLKFMVFTTHAPRMIACNGDRKPAIEMVAVKNYTPTVKNLLQNLFK